MANRFIDSVGHYNTANITKKYNETAGSWTVEAGGGPRGNNILQVTGDGLGGAYFARTFDDQATWVVGLRIKLSSLVSGVASPIRLFDGIAGAYQLLLKVQADGRLQVVRGDGTILGSASGSALFSNVWAYIEMKATIHPSAGIVQVRVDNTLVINLSGINTRNTSNSSASQVRLGSGNGSAVGQYCDIYVHDGTGGADDSFWGDTEIDYLAPNANGPTNDFAPVGSGTNYQNVDEAAPDTADYNESNTPTDRELYAFPDITGSPIIKCIQGVALMSKDDGNDRKVQLATQSDGSDYDGGIQDVPSSSGYLLEQWPDDPDTSADWIVADANAAYFGVTVNA